MRRQKAVAEPETNGATRTPAADWQPYSPDQPPPIKTETIWISPEQAAQWLAENNYERQRDIYDAHVGELVFALQQRQWSIQGIKFVKYNGEWRLTNGQHRLEAIKRAGIGTWDVVIWQDELPDEKAVAQEYYRTDRGKRRSVADALRAAGLGQEYSLTTAQVNAISGGVGLIMAGFAYTKPSIRNRLHLTNQDRRVEESEKWLPAGAKYFKAIKEPRGGRYRPLVLAATVGVGLVTFHYTPEQAEEFWFKVAHGQDLELDDPAQALLGVFSRRIEERSKPPLFARLVASCWNAHYEKRPLTGPRLRDTDSPIEIAGSPYTGRTTSSLINPSLVEE